MLNAILVKNGSIESAFLQFQFLFSKDQLQLGYAQSVNNFNLEKFECDSDAILNPDYKITAD